MFQQYPQSDVNEPILLHEGRFRVWAGDHCVEGSGSAHLRWLPSPGIEFDIEITEPFPGVGFDSLTVELPGFRTENESYRVSRRPNSLNQATSACS